MNAENASDHAKAIHAEMLELFPLRNSQICIYTDTLLVRNTDSGACGLGSCIYIEWRGQNYALTCSHVLKPDHEYFAGAKRLNGRLDEEPDHAVPPLKVIDRDSILDIALLNIDALDLAAIPVECYEIAACQSDLNRVLKNRDTAALICAVPGFATRGTQYVDGVVYLSAPILSAYGPIVDATDNKIVADFAEKELIECDTKSFPQLAELQLTGGTRHLGGMSGSGLWVYNGSRFELLGMLLGLDDKNDPKHEHRIKFLPIWKIKAWLQKILGGNMGSSIDQPSIDD